jgi:putative oxidoreductase
MPSPSPLPIVPQSLASRASVRARAFARRADFIAPLLARATVGYAFVESGWGKINNLATVTEYFTELGIPAPALQAPFVSLVELIGGALVLVGLATRLAAVPLIGTMVVALITAKASDISSFSDLIGTIEFCYAALLAWLAAAGAGKISLDHVIARRASPSATRDMLAASLARARTP